MTGKPIWKYVIVSPGVVHSSAEMFYKRESIVKRHRVLFKFIFFVRRSIAARIRELYMRFIHCVEGGRVGISSSSVFASSAICACPSLEVLVLRDMRRPELGGVSLGIADIVDF